MKCVTIFFCSTCAYGRAMELLMEDNCLLCCFLGTFCFCCNRGKIREKYNIKGTTCDDCLMCIPCCPCALFQIVAEAEQQNGRQIGCFGNLQDEDDDPDRREDAEFVR